MRRKNRPVKHGPTRPKIRRQWGTERRAGAAPIMHAVPSRRAMSGARFALFLTVAAWVAYFGEQVRRYVDHPFGVRGTDRGRRLPPARDAADARRPSPTCSRGSATCSASARTGGCPRAVIDAAFDESNPTLTAIVPSYKEERRVIRQTLLSAALQEFPNLRVVLLIDDPPNADRAMPRSASSTRRGPCRARSRAMLELPRRHFEEALDAFETSPAGSKPVAPRTSSGSPRPTTTPPSGSATMARGRGRHRPRRRVPRRTRSCWPSRSTSRRSPRRCATRSPRTPRSARRACAGSTGGSSGSSGPTCRASSASASPRCRTSRTRP